MTKKGQALPSNAPIRPRTLRWKKEPPETDLRAVLARPRSSYVLDAEGVRFRPRSSYLLDAEGVRFACVCANLAGGWYFVAGWESCIPHANTHRELVGTEAAAKAAAQAYVERHLPPKAPASRRRGVAAQQDGKS